MVWRVLLCPEFISIPQGQIPIIKPTNRKEVTIMKNMMKTYLGNEYSSNHLQNFCLYWMKAAEGNGDKWRAKNDLDCLCFNGDMRADTLMSAWTPVKWVSDCLNRNKGIGFYKVNKTGEDPYHDLKLLAEEGDKYLPPEHRLVKLLNRFLELAEQRCNFILLPERAMNTARYRSKVRGEWVWLCDEVPATLAHLFDKDSLGSFFLGKDGNVDEKSVADWIKREHLEMGFEDGVIDQGHVRPLIPGLDPYVAKWLKDEDEIYAALEYMVDFLDQRSNVFQDAASSDN